jgi:hypothetical protein
MDRLAAVLVANLIGSPVAVGEPLHVFVHFPSAVPGSLDRAIVFGAVLEAHGFDVVDLRPVNVQMRQPTIRYFEAGLRDEALQFGKVVTGVLREQGFESIEVRVQDFTFYAPKPRRSAIELWMAQ